MDQQLRTADVVCLCYAADSENVAERITHWLRHIRHTRQECRAPQVALRSRDRLLLLLLALPWLQH